MLLLERANIIKGVAFYALNLTIQALALVLPTSYG